MKDSLQGGKEGFNTLSTRWWIALVGSLLIGAFVQLHYFDHGLTIMIQTNDEARLYFVAYQHLQGLPIDDKDLIGYPPGLLLLEQAIYCTVVNHGCTGDKPQTSSVLHYVLLLAGITNLVTAVGIGGLTRLWASPAAGWLAATAWLLLPGIRAETVIGLTEAWQASAIVYSTLGMTLALKTRRPVYALLSISAGLVAVIFKYSAFPVLGLGVVATLWLFWCEPVKRRLWALTLVTQIALIAACAGLLLWGYSARQTFTHHAEVITFISGNGNLNVEFLSDERGLPRILSTHAAQLALPLLFTWGSLAAGAFIYARQREDWQRVAWGLGLGLLICHLLLILTYIIHWIGAKRYITPVAGLSVALVVSAVWVGVSALLTSLHRPRWSRWVLLFLGGIWLLPAAWESVNLALTRARPDTHSTYIRWTETSLPADGTLLIDPADWLFFNVVYGNVPGLKRTWTQGHIVTFSRLEWLEQGIRYAYITTEEVKALQATDGGQAALNQMLLLKAFPPTNSPLQWNGPTFGVYRLYAPQTHTNVTFGPHIQLVGFDVSTTVVRAGDTLTLTPFWQANAMPERDYNVYLHLVSLTSREVLAQADGLLGLPQRPTTTWDDAGETLIGSPLSFVLPTNLAAGDYRLIVGVYAEQIGQRLTTHTGEDFAELTTIQILPSGR